MNNDTGSGWVQRWFAKPFTSGSIPARVSIHNRALGKLEIKFFRPRQWRFWLGRRLAIWVLSAPDDYPRNCRSFRAGLLYAIETTHALSPAMMDRLRCAQRAAGAEEDARRFKAQMIDAKKELSALKRKTT